MKGSKAVVEVLKREGVDIIFGYPGGTALPLYDALYNSGIKHILTRHEQGAAHAADGYARATGKTGVCVSTSGPGATNLITGIATAYMDSSPTVFITCQVVSNLIGKDSFQEADIRGITTPITKHNFLVEDPNELTTILRKAFYLANTGRKGPVVVDIPKDFFLMDVAEDFDKPLVLRGYQLIKEGDPDNICQVCEAIKESSKPLFFIGGGMTLSDSALLFKEIVDKTGIPVVTSLMGIGAYPTGEELNLGMVGMHGNVAANLAVQECDLLIGMGVRFDDRVTGLLDKFAPNAKIIHFEIDPAELNKNVPVDIRVLADLSWSLAELNKKVEKPSIDSWVKKVLQTKQEKPITYEPSTDGVIKPQEVIEKIYEITKGEAIIVADTGQHQMWTAQLYKYHNPRSFLTSGGLGSMGFGLPAAMGAQLGKPHIPVWVVVGDGGFMMNCQEVATIVEHNLPIKIIVMNNRGLGMVRQWQRLFFDERYSGSKHHIDTEFAKVACAFGADGERVIKEEDLIPALKRAANSNNPLLLDIMVSENENVLPMVATGKPLDEIIE